MAPTKRLDLTAAPRLRGPRPRTLQRPPGAIPDAGRTVQSTNRDSHHARAVFSRAAAASRSSVAEAVGGVDAQEPAARSTRRFPAGGLGGGPIPTSDSR